MGGDTNPGGLMVINRGDIFAFESGSTVAPTQVIATQTPAASSTPAVAPVSAIATPKVTHQAATETIFDDSHGAFVHSEGWLHEINPQAYNGYYKRAPPNWLRLISHYRRIVQHHLHQRTRIPKRDGVCGWRKSGYD